MRSTMTRAEARAQGLRHFYSGEPCRHGHNGIRYTQSGACYACIKASVDQMRNEFKAAQEADVARPELIRFIKETLIVNVRLPEAQVRSLGSIVAGMLSARFPLLVAHERVNMAPASTLSRRMGSTCMATYLAHRDDAAAIKTLAENAMRAHALTTGGTPR